MMAKIRYICIGLLAITLSVKESVSSFDNVLTAACEKGAKECSFTLDVEYLLTMVYDDESTGIGRIVVERDGKLYKRLPSTSSCGTIEELTDEESEKVIFADGQHRVVYAINKQYPGPPIVVYEGTEVIIKVTNWLRNELITIHWHGEEMTETPWMDGVQDVNQCGIRPGEAFTYRFTPKKPGTYWYHGHVGEVRQEGLYGAFIVLEKKLDKVHEKHLKDMVTDGKAEITGEFVLHIQDFYAEMSSKHIVEGVLRITGPTDYNDLEKCTFRTRRRTGGTSHPDIFHSALINGKGQYYEEGSETASVQVPEETLLVDENKIYRIRIIHSGVGYGFKLTIDKHKLHVISMDGRGIEPVIVDSVVVNAGERFDVLIMTSETPSDYAIHVETLERYSRTWGDISPHYVKGSLLYVNAEDDASEATVCDESQPCSIFNCVSGSDESTSTCLTMNDARSTPTAQKLVPPPEITDDFKEVFLDFNLQKSGSIATVNNKLFVWPTTPPMIAESSLDSIITPCTDTSEAVESCTHILKVAYGSTVQLVLTNLVANYDPATTGWMDHPIHIHGYHFTILKVGYPTYDEDGVVEQQSADVKCLDSACLQTGWTDDAWNGGNIPDIDLANSRLKDTVVVPVGGYVVVRIKADNPGYWLLHCHTEKHMAAGMAMIVQVGEPEDMRPPPPGMPNDCGTFEWDGSFKYLKKKNKKNKEDSLQLDVAAPGTVGAMTGGSAMVIIAVSCANLLILAVTLSVAYTIKKRKRGYKKISVQRNNSRDEKATLLRP